MFKFPFETSVLLLCIRSGRVVVSRYVSMHIHHNSPGVEPSVPQALCATVSKNQMVEYNCGSHSMHVTIEIKELVMHMMRLRPQLR